MRRIGIHCVCIVLAIFAVFVADAWSGNNTYTLVVLTSIDQDESLRDAFYNAPAGTAFRIPVSGYDIIQDGNDGNTYQETFFPLDKIASSATLFSRQAPYPFATLLSSEWVVLEKPAPHKCAGASCPSAMKNDYRGSILLHCRLPLPRDPNAIASAVSSYLALRAPEMERDILSWWTQLAHQRPSLCLYGDGEGAVTGTPRYYEVCPLEGVYRVKKGALLRVMAPTMPPRDPDAVEEIQGASKAHAAQGGKAKTPNILDLLSQMHSSALHRQILRSDPRIAIAFEEVGRYHAMMSYPRWNQAQKAWEMVYPSKQPCDLHVSKHIEDRGTDAKARQTGKVFHHEGRESSSSNRFPSATIGADDPFWKTVIRLRCPNDYHAKRRSSRMQRSKIDDIMFWSINEARQLCRYEVELETTLVCEWERELDKLVVNPIPCVKLK
ncbi:unnamed protein product [Phytomonas sp. EM1]|nr:unnamed protein product [Phytomonas sp. EM1]|eukprot:CCW63328.1 unnamed protein product [Phytomonas sp. isolate EM1]